VEPAQRSIVVDMSGLVEPDPGILDALVRLQLAAQRLGTSICLENACPKLVDLLALVGLSEVLPEVLPALASGIEMDRQVEQREQVRVDEEIESGDEAG
jgi:anti-anti-sigma regulatory factor